MKKIIMKVFLSFILIGTLVVKVGWAETFKVGVQLSLSGPLANAGNGPYEGILTAVEIFNRDSGHKIELITIDDESRAANAVSAVERLISQHVIAILGGTSSDKVIPAAAIASRAGIPYITAGSASDEVLTLGYQTIFRLTNMKGYVLAVSEFLAEMMPDVKNISVLYSTQIATNETAKLFEKIQNEKGYKVTMHPYEPNMRDFKSILNKVRLIDKSDAIIMVGFESDYVGIIRAAKVLKPKIKAIIGTWYITNRRIAVEFPDLVKNVFGGEFLAYPVNFKTEEGKKLEAVFNEIYNRTPDYANIVGYTQAIILFESILRSHDNDSLNIRGSLTDEIRLTDRETLMGRVKFNEVGETMYFKARIAQHQDGKIVLICPKEYATGKMKYPAIPW